MSKIILYTMEGCPYCIKLVNLLNEKGLPFEEGEISHFREEFDKLKCFSAVSLFDHYYATPVSTILYSVVLFSP